MLSKGTNVHKIAIVIVIFLSFATFIYVYINRNTQSPSCNNIMKFRDQSNIIRMEATIHKNRFYERTSNKHRKQKQYILYIKAVIFIQEKKIQRKLY